MSSTTVERERRPERRRAAWVGLVACLVYLPFFHGHFMGTDELGVFFTTRALYETQSFAVPEGPHRYPGRDGRTYAHFAPGLPVVALPLYAAGAAAERTLPPRWLAALHPRPEEAGRIDTLANAPLFAVALYAPLASGLLVAVFFLLERRLGASVRGALLASALLGATSYVAAQSVYFLRHTSEAILLLASFGALLAFRSEGRARDLALGSLFASLTLLVAVPATVALLPLVAYALVALAARLGRAEPAERARLLAAAALPALAALAAHAALNQALWGTWLESPMVAQRSRFTAALGEGLLGFLVSPGASVVAYSPILLLAPLWLRAFGRTHRAECAVLLAVSLVLLLFCSSFELWPGLWSAPGPRYLFVLTPLLLLPLGLWLDAGPGPRARGALLALAALGAFVQLGLVAARWSEVIRRMGYRESVAASGFDFLFRPLESPIVGSWRVVLSGGVDAWLWQLVATGRGALAAALLAAWALALACALAGLRRSVRGVAP